MAFAFDPDQPGARRLVEMARAMKQLERPTRVEILAPLVVDEDGRVLHCGDRPLVPAGFARVLIDDGLARDASG